MFEKVAQKRLEIAAQKWGDFSDAFVADAETIYVETVPFEVWGGAENLVPFLQAYIGVVGLLPEDCYAIRDGFDRAAGVNPLCIVYRDRPAYAEGRTRFQERLKRWPL